MCGEQRDFLGCLDLGREGVRVFFLSFFLGWGGGFRIFEKEGSDHNGGAHKDGCVTDRCPSPLCVPLR